MPVVLVLVIVPAPTNDDMLSHGQDDKVGTVLSHTARGTLNPAGEESLQERLKNWTWFATDYIPYHPLGIGIGGTQVGAWRYNAELELPPIDSYFISTVITCGLPAALLFMWILIRAFRMSWRSLRHAEARVNEASERLDSSEDEEQNFALFKAAHREATLWRVAATLLPALILNSMFGNTFTLYSVAPVGWMLIGWISAASLRQTTSE